MASTLCPTSCSVPGTTTVVGTLTGGIQDVSAILPLLGTEQCEQNVSSALTNGYLYAAASPMSLFGSLGLARAGFKTFLASVNFSIRNWSFDGAQALSNMGFQPQGENLSLIMADKNNKGRYMVETRLDELLNDLHLNKTEIKGISHKSGKWNCVMVFLSAFFSSLGVIPYIYLNTETGSSLPLFTRWSFPVIRATGGFLTTTMMQFIIQRRITTIAGNMLAERHGSQGPEGGVLRDPEKAFEGPGSKSATTDGFTWALLFLLLLGDVASVVGYIGCFSVVQSASETKGPVSWICLEAGLSLLRIFLWGLNPKADDAPPLELILKLDDQPPLPTCNKYDDNIWEDRILPLARSSEFLNSITSFAGLVKRFDHPDLTLYYTFTWGGTDPESEENDEPRKPLDRVLYVTIFDHKERTTRVFMQNDTGNHFFSTPVPIVDLEYGLLEAHLGEEIPGMNDPVVGDDDVRNALVEHYQSLSSSTTSSTNHGHDYRIGNVWTMKSVDVVPANKSAEYDGRGTPSTDIPPERDRLYLQQGRFERIQTLLVAKRGQWITAYMEFVVAETNEWLLGQEATITPVDRHTLADAGGEQTKRPASSTEEEHKEEAEADLHSDLDANADADATPKKSEIHHLVDLLMIEERRCMEKLLCYEVEAYEAQLWNSRKAFVRSCPDQEKERLRREWKANCWKRMDSSIRAMDARMEAAKVVAVEHEEHSNDDDDDDFSSNWQSAHDDIRAAWQSMMARFFHGRSTPSPRPILTPLLERLKQDFGSATTNVEFSLRNHHAQTKNRLRKQLQETERRLLKELEDVKLRLKHGLEQRADPFWNNEQLFKCRHSRSKWLRMPMDSSIPDAALDAYTRALKKRRDIIYVDFIDCDDDWIVKLISGMPSLTSVLVYEAETLRKIQRDTPLFIGTFDAKLTTFLDDNESLLMETPRTFIFISSGASTPDFDALTAIGLRGNSTIAVSFLGPTTGNLTLRLRHHSGFGITLVVADGSHTFNLRVPTSLTCNDIVLHPDVESLGLFSFKPDIRNNVVIQVCSSSIDALYWLQDIQLLDELGQLYNPRS